MLASALPDCWPINVPALCSGLNVLDILYALEIIIILLPTYLFLISLHPSVSLPTCIHSLYALQFQIALRNDCVLETLISTLEPCVEFDV